MNKLIVFVFLSFLLANSSQAQNRFKGSFVTGLTLAQVDGDALVGFNKAGITAGVKVAYPIKQKFDGNVEILYSQRGSRESLFGGGDLERIIRLNYFELPIYVSIKDWYIEKEKYYKMKADLGFSYGSLVNSFVQGEGFSQEDFRDNDFSWLVGASYSFTPHWTLTVRYTRSVTKILPPENPMEFGLLSYFWTIRGEYSF